MFAPFKAALPLVKISPVGAGYFAMTNLALIVDQIKNEITVDETGKGRASIRAVARLMDVDEKALRAAFRSAEQNLSKLAQLLILQGFDCAEQNSWSQVGIPDIAIAKRSEGIAQIAKYYAYLAGRYCREQAQLVFDVFTAMGVRTWIHQIKGWKVEQQEEVKQIPSVQEITATLDAIFGTTDIDTRLIAGVKANQIGKIYPQLKSVTEAAKTLLSIPIDDQLITPSKLAQLYAEKTKLPKMSAQAFNKMLEEHGLQIKNPDGKNPSWLPTETGKLHSQLTLDEAKGNNKTVQSLKWFPSVLDII